MKERLALRHHGRHHKNPQVNLLHKTLGPSILGGALALALFAMPPGARGADKRPAASSPRIYVQPQAEGFESYIAAAVVKKHVPAVITQNKDEAVFYLTSTVLSKEESTGSKVVRCLFLYCAGAAGSQTATVQLVRAETQEVAWAYNVQKAAATAYQSTAESIAKHLKKFLEDHPQ